MYCNQCGQLLTEEVKFCPECGAKQDEYFENKNVKEKRRKHKKSLWISVLIVMILFGLVISYILINREGNKYQTMNGEWVIYNGEGILSSWGERYKEDIYREKNNADCSILVYLTENTELYYTDVSLKIKKIAKDVDSFDVSYTGSNIAYFKNVDEKGYGDLYLYSVKDEESIKIDTDVSSANFKLSPEGNKITYTKLNGDICDLYQGGISTKKQKIDSGNISPVALNDSGDCLFYIDYEEAMLYEYNGKDTMRLASNINSSSDCLGINCDATEIVFVSNEKTYFYSRDMEEPVKVSGKRMNSIVDPNELGISTKSKIYGVKSLKGCVLSSDDGGLYWLNSDGSDAIKITSNYEEVLISMDGERLVYLYNGNVYRVDSLAEKIKEVVLYDGDIEHIVASQDLKRVYYVEEENLYFLKKNNEPVRISNDLTTNVYSIEGYVAYNNFTGKVFFVENNNLMAAEESAKTKEKVIEDVNGVTMAPNGIRYSVYEKNDDEIDVSFYYMNDEVTIKLYEE